MAALWAFLTPGPPEMMIILVIAVLLFGKRLPEVARSLGRSMVEFEKGVRGIEDEIHAATREASVESSAVESSAAESEEREEATAPKFEPPAAEPKPETDEASKSE